MDQGTFTPRHATVELITPSNEVVDIDRGIADLIQALWAIGITTFYCCEGDDHRSYLDENETRRKAAYILMKRDAFSMEFIKAIFSDYIRFEKSYSTFMHVEVDSHPIMGDRICLRFPNHHILEMLRFLRRGK